MKIKNNTVLCVFALSTLAATFGSCQSEDDALNGLPQGSVPLVLDDVTVAGAQTVNNRAAGGSTRAAISENAAGYTGIRKSRFVNGDVLNLTLSNGSGESAVTTSVIATLTGGKWVLTPEKVFITPGVTEISATHTATEQTAGIATDDLAAANADCALTAATGTLSIAMKHAGAMIDITPGATDGATITSVTVNTDVPTAAEEEAATGGSGTELHYRTLIATTTTVSSISAVVGGTTYVATLATPLTVAANKRYPVTLTFKEQTLSATVSAPQDWTDGGTIKPAGYTYIIDSPEALAQFARDVNDDVAGTGASQAIVLQTADIDLSQLKPVADAGTNPLTGSAYTYTATADYWVSIGTSVPFKGKYNGNGYTISNLKGSRGLFNNIADASLTGIHLRGVSLRGAGKDTGSLVNTVSSASSNLITLCSATGSITSGDGEGAKIGGLIGLINNGSTVTRCKADVAIDVSGMTGQSACAGGLIGFLNQAHIIACTAAGEVNGGSQTAGGFVGGIDSYSYIYHCIATGNVQGSACAAFIGKYIGSYETMKASFASGTVTGSDSNFIGYDSGPHDYADCAYTGTLTTTISGITGNVAVADLYTTVTASNASREVKTLHWSAVDGYTLTEVTNTWYAKHIWKDNGTATPTLDLGYEGTPLYNSLVPNLLAIPGQTAYYVAPEDAKNASGQLPMPWADTTADGVCPLGWHVPTKDEFVAMTGLTAGQADADTNNAAIVAVFPAGVHYWSSTEYGADAWYLYVNPNGTSSINHILKSNAYRMRCVRAK